VSRPGHQPALPEPGPALAALLLAVDSKGLGGAVWRGAPGPERDAWLELLAAMLPAETPRVRVPVNVSQERLLGGLDFASTMAAGRPVFATGLLEAANEGLLVIAMAERMEASTCALVNGVLDSGLLVIEREGLTRRTPAAFGVVALDEGIDDEAVDESLCDRLAFAFDLRGGDPVVEPRQAVDAGDWKRDDVAAARERLEHTELSDEAAAHLVHAAAAFGISSFRAVMFALRAARAAAALRGVPVAEAGDIALAAQLVLAHRATRVPAEEPPEQDEPESMQDTEDPNDQENRSGDRPPDDVIVDAIRANLPPGLLELLASGQAQRQSRSAGSRGGPRMKSKRRGRPIGSRPGELTAGNRLNVLATLKSAAPWQPIRRTAAAGDARPIQLRKDDIHVNRFEDRKESTTIFAVDASGSQAAQRLAEVKGAIELLLNDCYVRRDQVALIAFRGQSADALLPPTRALARVKRSLRALPGGGGTPLAAGLDAARELALSEARHGRDATIVLLTDGRANISRDGNPGAETAEQDARDSGSLIRSNGIRSLLVDTSRRPRPRAQALAQAMDATYIPLPRADAQAISETVQRNVG